MARPPRPPLSAALRRRILRAYQRPGHPVALSTPSRVAKHFGVTLKQAKHLLERLDSYTLHREYKQPRHYNPFYVHSRREQVQADLIDISKIEAQNDGVRFLLLLIDIFSKRVWVCPLRSKNGATMKLALGRWLNSLDVKPKNLLTDRGLEFTVAGVQEMLRRHGVRWHPALGTVKASIAERANKTIQLLIYKYLTDNETLEYLPALPDLVRTYNGRGHRSLNGMTPDEADTPAREGEVQTLLHDRYAKLGQLRRHKLPLRVGQLVRIKTEAKKVSSSARSYAEQFKPEFYSITRINRTLPIALYYVKSVDTGEHVEGGFYAEELQPQRGNIWKVERVLRRRVRNGETEYRVKWRWFGRRWNSWVKESDILRRYHRQ